MKWPWQKMDDFIEASRRERERIEKQLALTEQEVRLLEAKRRIYRRQKRDG